MKRNEEELEINANLWADFLSACDQERGVEWLQLNSDNPDVENVVRTAASLGNNDYSLRLVIAEFNALRKGIRFIHAKRIKNVFDDGFLLDSGETILIKDCTPCGEYIADRGVLLLEGCNPAIDLYYPSRQNPLRIALGGHREISRQLFALFRKNGYQTFDMT